MFKIKLKQIKHTEITFEASSGKIRNIIYQKYYDTGWTPEDNQHNNKQAKVIWDIPDIIITSRNDKVIVIDAKNSDLN
ncbi:hypothetical protein [Candidatus Nitrosocosmicus sp. T]